MASARPLILLCAVSADAKEWKVGDGDPPGGSRAEPTAGEPVPVKCRERDTRGPISAVGLAWRLHDHPPPRTCATYLQPQVYLVPTTSGIMCVPRYRYLSSITNTVRDRYSTFVGIFSPSLSPAAFRSMARNMKWIQQRGQYHGMAHTPSSPSSRLFHDHRQALPHPATHVAARPVDAGPASL